LYSKETKRSIDFHFRLPRELEEKLEMYRKEKQHPSLSHTFRYFLKLGIKSTELLEELKDDPSKKENIVAEWNDLLNHMNSGNVIENELAKISDEELETVVMKAYCELEQRKRDLQRKEFQSKKNVIEHQLDPNMGHVYDDVIPPKSFIGPVKTSDPFWN
jgi:hypothetical protein